METSAASGMERAEITTPVEGFAVLAILIIYVLLFSVTYYMYYPPKYDKSYPWFKFATSLGFILTATYSAILSNDFQMFYRMLPAFILAASGDLLLGLAHSKHDYYSKEFLSGTCAFLAAHIVFYAALTSIDAPRLIDFVLPVIVMGVIYLISRSKNVRLGRMKIPAIVYSFFVGLLFSKSLMIILYSGRTIPHLLILIGSFLFLTSDIILLFLNYHIAPPKWLAFGNLSTYYAGIVLLGLSLYPF